MRIRTATVRFVQLPWLFGGCIGCRRQKPEQVDSGDLSLLSFVPFSPLVSAFVTFAQLWSLNGKVLLRWGGEIEVFGGN